jgi:peptidoglycan hydrolase-like protein with peptidoglycan-binding domain
MVKCLQYLLRNAGYQGIAVDGKFGKQTLWFVMQFQKAHGLKVDGYVGGQTWMKLIQPVQMGDGGDAVRAVQLMVGDKMPINGKFGPATKAAVVAYQKDYNENFVAKWTWRLKEDGIVGPQTWNALLSSYDD